MFAKEVYVNRRNTLKTKVGSGILLFLGTGEAAVNYAGNASKGIIMGIYLTDGTITTGIKDITVGKDAKDGKTFNIGGQVVNGSYKGIVIKNGKKHIAK